MSLAREIFHYSKLEKPRVRKGKIGKQKNGNIMQEAYFLKDLEGFDYDFEACAACNHCYVIPVGMNITEVLNINEDLRKSHTKAITKWNSISATHRPTKPKTIGHISQHLAYMWIILVDLMVWDASNAWSFSRSKKTTTVMQDQCMIKILTAPVISVSASLLLFIIETKLLN